MSRPMVFRLVPPEWTTVWEALDSLRLFADTALVGSDGECAYALLDACMQQLLPLWEAQAEELTASDPRCAYERAALTCDPPEGLASWARWVGTKHGALIVRYADGDHATEPTWLGDSRQLLRSLLVTLKKVTK